MDGMCSPIGADLDGGAMDGSGTDGGTGADGGCIGETDVELCSRAVAQCGAVAMFDRCGAYRQVASCGGCTGTTDFCIQNACVPLSCSNDTQACDGSCIAACFACPASPRAHCDNGFELYRFGEEALSSQSIGPANARVRFDAAGVVHAAWTRRVTPVTIEYATNQSGAWAIETVATVAALPEARVYGAKLALAGCETAIAFIRSHVPEGTFDGVVQAHLAMRTGGGFSEELIPVPTSPIDSTPSTSVASVDLVPGPAGTLIAAARVSSSTYLLTRSASGQWSVEHVAAVGTSTISAPVLTYSALLGPVLAYGYGSSTPTIAYKDGGAWVTSSVPGARPIRSVASNYAAQIGVAVDSAGTIYLAWGADELNGSKSLYVSRRVGTTWSTPYQVANASGWASDNLNIWMDANDVARLTYEAYGVGGSVRPMAAFAEGDVWHSQGIATGVSGTAVGMTDARGRLFLLVGDADGLELRPQECAVCEGGFCPQVVAAAGAVGSDNAIALDGVGHPVISYSDTTRRVLRLARFNGSRWTREAIDSSAYMGHNDIAIDRAGNPHVSYWDVTNLDLKYARWTGDAWAIETVDDVGDVGGFNSIALDADGRAHIAYFDSTATALKYARWSGDAWAIETVDDDGDVGRYASLALDDQGRAQIAYADYTRDDLRYARRASPSAWTIQTVDDGNCGRFADLALDSAGRGHISYHDGGSDDLRYARWDGVQWRLETVVSESAVAIGTAIAVDENDEPHIVFNDSNGAALRHVRRIGGAWSPVVTLDAFSNLCTSLDIALDTHDRAHVSYCDPNNSDLLYSHD